MPLKALQWRYAVKRFDSSLKIAQEAWDLIEQSLLLTPSSFGLQPWRAIVVESAELREQLSVASWNQPQPRECSHFVVLTARRDVGEEYVDEFLTVHSETTGLDLKALAGYRNVILQFLAARQGNHFEWSARQAYIVLGQLLTLSASMQIDACPMEGIEADRYDEILQLTGTDYGAVVACALGYRHAEDRYAIQPKVRFDRSRMIEYR